MDRVPGRQRHSRDSGEGGQPKQTAEEKPAAADLRPGTPTTCTGPNCGRAIAWAVTVEGRRMPLDPTPDADGNVILQRQPDGSIRARVLAGDELPAQQTAWVPHHRTCPDAADFRRRQAALAPKCRAGCRYPMDPWLVAHGWHYHVKCAPPTRAEIDAQRAYEASRQRRTA